MRTLFYILLFITPTVLVLVYREHIHDMASDMGLVAPRPDREAPTAPASPDEDPSAPSLTKNAPLPPNTSPTTREGVEAQSRPADIDRMVAEKYPMPSFKPLEDYVGNWRDVPQRAYPETVTLKKPVDLELIVNGKVAGKSTLRVGQHAYPISMKRSTLIVSGRANDPTMRGEIALDDTDFKDQVRKAYNAWKTKHEGRVHKLRKEEKQRLLASGGEAPPLPEASSSSSGVLGEAPKVNADGTVPVMIASIQAGDVKEIELDKIHYWKWIGEETIGGEDYWTGAVGYLANTIFGEINAEGKALIRDGKVVKWIYSGSEEEIR